MKEIDFTQIEGFKTGHATDSAGGTGCTVIISEKGAAAGCDIRGTSPATRETDLLRPENIVEKINAVVLSGGSAFGLEAADGVMRYLKDIGVGFETSCGVVPIVCGASLFDLALGEYDSYPDKEMGYEACVDAAVDQFIENGCYGAGTGATVGKYYGVGRMMKSGIGSYAVDVDGVKVGAIVAVNSFGNVLDEAGVEIAGLLDEEGRRIISTEKEMMNNVMNDKSFWGSNTTIGCVITNASLTKAQCTKVSQMAHDGMARAIRPVHTSADGDAIFTMAGGSLKADPDAVGVLAAMAVQQAIICGVKSANSAYDIPSYLEIRYDR